MSDDYIVFVGDAGATNQRVCAYSVSLSGLVTALCVPIIDSIRVPMLELLRRLPGKPDYIVIGGAGQFDAAADAIVLFKYPGGGIFLGPMRKHFGVPIDAGNDLQIQSYALGTPATADTEVVLPRILPFEPPPETACSVIFNLGTGTGIGAKTPTGVRSMECGNSPIPTPRHPAALNSLLKVIADLRAKGVTCYRLEDLLCGPGLVVLADTLCPDDGRWTSASVTQAILDGDPWVQDLALLFGELLALKMQDMVYVFGPCSTIYLVGTVLSRIGPILTSAEFVKTLRTTHGQPHQTFLDRLEVRMIKNDNIGLDGAAYYAAEKIKAGLVTKSA